MSDLADFFERTFRLVTSPRLYSEENFVKYESKGMQDAIIYLSTCISLVALAPLKPDVPPPVEREEMFSMFVWVASNIISITFLGYIVYLINKKRIKFGQCWSIVLTSGCLALTPKILDLYVFEIPFLQRSFFMILIFVCVASIMLSSVTKKLIGYVLFQVIIAGFAYFLAYVPVFFALKYLFIQEG